MQYFGLIGSRMSHSDKIKPVNKTFVGIKDEKC